MSSPEMREFRYQMIEHGSDEDVIHALDFWLENWLYHKAHCPNCSSEVGE